MKVDWQDGLIGALVVLCGMTAGALLILKGEGEVLPFLAAGGVLGATLVGRFLEDEEQDET